MFIIQVFIYTRLILCMLMRVLDVSLKYLEPDLVPSID